MFDAYNMTRNGLVENLVAESLVIEIQFRSKNIISEIQVIKI